MMLYRYSVWKTRESELFDHWIVYLNTAETVHSGKSKDIISIIINFIVAHNLGGSAKILLYYKHLILNVILYASV